MADLSCYSRTLLSRTAKSCIGIAFSTILCIGAFFEQNEARVGRFGPEEITSSISSVENTTKARNTATDLICIIINTTTANVNST